MSVLEITQGDYSDIECSERNLRNDWQKDRDEQRDYNVHFLLEQFEGEKAENPFFYYEFKVDDNKLNDKLGAIAHRKEFNYSFLRCVWDSKTHAEFKNEWADVISKNNLKDNEWLNVIFKIRQSWILAYDMDQNIFTAGIRTTQRAESMNAFIGKFVNNKNTLLQFVLRIDRAIMKQ
ncbi:hypothetical protein CFOL_v3_27872 [Cephalotus follicularis]|uniref:Uncharacterized protein n=1 Tax=Cephalotus follicularis TaxID=3775 RepID=A0A1Q3CWH7_CEPFO|nr:hypothetical protein CFOL_v3_27872 [Cephalotus follicularis]